jgi:phenylalanyl-tRNA synthetase beta chain
MKFRLEDLKNYLEGKIDVEKILNDLNLKAFETSYENGIFDIDILYNRFSDSASLLGIAKEISILTDLKFKEPKFKLKESKRKIDKEVKLKVVSQKTPFYFGRVILNVKNSISPNWLKEFLNFYGLNSINLLVDLSNFVMFEYGAPLHIFDLDKVKEKEIIVREAKKGEKFISLEGNEYELQGGEIVITDKEKILALAGIKGSKLAEVDLNTKNIFIEAAVFDPVSIYQTSRKLNVKTEASLRFERKVNPHITLKALDRISYLIQKHAGGEILKGKFAFGKLERKKEIKIELSHLNKFLGTNLKASQVKNLLKKLKLDFKQKGDTFTIYPPLERNDLNSKEDIYEEILRMYGVNNVKENFEPLLHPAYLDENLSFNFKLREVLKEFGYSEIFNYSLFSEKEKEIFIEILEENSEPIEILNPISENYKFFEFTLLSGLFKGLSLNQKNFRDLKIYRLERVSFLKENKPIERYSLALACLQKEKDLALKEIKTCLEFLKKKLRLKFESETFKEKNYSFLSLGADIYFDNEKIGIIGILNHKVKNFYDIDWEVGFMELNLEKIKKMSLDYEKFVFWGNYPEVIRDLSFIVDKRVNTEEILETLKQVKLKNLKSYKLLDIYFIQEDKKSYTFRFIFQSDEKTLKDEEVEELLGKIKNLLENKFKVEFR